MLIDKPTEKKHLGSPRHRQENQTIMHIKEMGANTRNWVDSAQDRDYRRDLVNKALNLRVPYIMELITLHISGM